MEFQDLPIEITDKVTELLNDHLAASAPNLAKDKCVLPMLLTHGNTSNSDNIMSLQPENGQTDVDKALAVAIQYINKIDFEYALFSYSTQIGLSNGGLTNALKTYIVFNSGLTVVFFTPYRISGLIKKKVAYDKSIIGEIIENILE